jgi:hypothetical protein
MKCNFNVGYRWLVLQFTEQAREPLAELRNAHIFRSLNSALELCELILLIFIFLSSLALRNQISFAFLLLM